MNTSLSDLPYIAFLTAYPHPAFIIHGRKRYGQGAATLNPIFGNPAFRSLLFGPEQDTAELGYAFLKALDTIERAQRLAYWLEGGKKDVNLRQETLLIEVKPSWTPLDASLVSLELTQTIMGKFIICTSTPRSNIPKYIPRRVSSTSPSSRIGRDFNMRIPDFSLASPHNNPSILGTVSTSFASAIRTSSSDSGRNSLSPERHSDMISQRPGQDMKEMIESFNWHLTPLGPRHLWDSILKAALNFILAYPYPAALWWGPELVLLYNDAYKEMSGPKHPRIFGERGSASWGELWDHLGPLADRVFNGLTIAKQDDMLFFNRLTEAKLPEETYHTWSWVPISGDEGKVVGMINTNFETTQKVLSERRMLFLRDLANSAGLARTQVDFAKAVLDVISLSPKDCPFAAFYFSNIKETGAPIESGPRTSYIRRPIDAPPMKIELRQASTVAVPEFHRSFPQTIEIAIEPLTLRHSPQTRSHGSPGAVHQPYDNTLRGARSPSVNTSDSKAVLSPIPESDPTRPPLDSVSAWSSETSITTKPSEQELTIMWPFEEAITSRRPVHVPNLPDYIVEGLEIRGWGEHAREAVVIPIVVDDSDLPSAVLIVGLNSRRGYDTEYASWVDLIRLSLNSLMTAVKGREADLIRAEHLAQLDSAKTAFFSNVSHELRTPLTLIQGPLQDSLALISEGKAKEHLKMASRNVLRLSRLVDSLMDFSKLAANRLEGRFRAVQLGSYTADLAALFRSVIEKGNIEYIVDCDFSERKLCYIDPDFWEKIIFNLIGNAYKYTMCGSIRVTLTYDKDYAYFRVKDTGVGIPETDIEKVFERFHRVDATSRSHEGTGIGLALTKELVKLHGGTLTVVSKTEATDPENFGSCFTVALPLGKNHLPAAHIIQDDGSIPHQSFYARGIIDEATHWSARLPDERTPSESSDSGGSSEGSKMDPSTLFFSKSDIILLVDDNADMRRYIRSLFTPYCQVMEAANGQEALRILDSVTPNLILSDVMMPVLDGYGLIAHVRQKKNTNLTPIILVTAKESEESRVEGLLSGADDYMSKPFTGKELIARVHLQMQLGKRRIELEARFVERTREIQLLSDLSPVGIIRADDFGNVHYANDRWREISGFDPLSVGDAWPVSVREEDQESVLQCWKAAYELHEQRSKEFRFKNGTYAKGSFQPLQISGVIGTITDISDQRLLEESRLAHVQDREAEARRRAEDAEERRKEADERRRGQELLIDVTSHELRQPVSAILNCSSLVRSNLAKLRHELMHHYQNNELFSSNPTLLQGMDEDLEALDAIYQCGLAQERIANDVLSLSRIQLQILSIQPVAFDLVSEVQRIVAIFRNELKMKHIELDLRFGKTIKQLRISRIRSDKLRFAQVITNLLSNAIKFTDTSPDKREIDVTVEVSRYPPPVDGPCIPPEESVSDVPTSLSTGDDSIFVYVAVKDSGPGLKPDDLNLLFQRFQQGSNSHNVFGGSGLGLFVSRKLCDLLGGRIEVASVYGEGATFRFFIKVIAIANSERTPPIIYDSPEMSRIDSTHSSTLSDIAFDTQISSPLHILITEDNLINQTVLNRQLKNAGCTTALASNGLQAIQQIQKLSESKDPTRTHFDAILMDCEMPVMDGLTAVRKIREMEEANELPARNLIFALTGNAREGQVRSALEAGMDEVIIKPYKLDELLVKIQDAVTLRGT